MHNKLFWLVKHKYAGIAHCNRSLPFCADFPKLNSAEVCTPPEQRPTGLRHDWSHFTTLYHYVVSLTKVAHNMTFMCLPYLPIRMKSAKPTFRADCECASSGAFAILGACLMCCPRAWEGNDQ